MRLRLLIIIQSVAAALLSGCQTTIPFTLVNDKTGEKGGGVLYAGSSTMGSGRPASFGMGGEPYNGTWSHTPTPKNPDRYFFSGETPNGNAIRCTATFSSDKTTGECSDNRNNTYTIKSQDVE